MFQKLLNSNKELLCLYTHFKHQWSKLGNGLSNNRAQLDLLLSKAGQVQK